MVPVCPWSVVNDISFSASELTMSHTPGDWHVTVVWCALASPACRVSAPMVIAVAVRIRRVLNLWVLLVWWMRWRHRGHWSSNRAVAVNWQLAV